MSGILMEFCEEGDLESLIEKRKAEKGVFTEEVLYFLPSFYVSYFCFM
jgi:hypothetical protein